MPFDTNWFDIIVLFAAIFGVWSGLRSGLTGELIGAIGFILMIVVAVTCSQPLGTWLQQTIGLTPDWANLSAFVALIGTVLLVTAIARNITHNRMKQRRFSATVENVGGAVAGAVRMIVVMACLTVVICMLRDDYWLNQVGRESRFGSFVGHQTPVITELLKNHSVDGTSPLPELKRRSDPDFESSRR
jgi:uncharacterized membrane protein required for colicin V production